MIRIVLIDDHAIVRTGLRLILKQEQDIDVIAEADDGGAGLNLIRELKPDVALVDLHMPTVSGIEVTERVRRSHLSTQIVVLTMAMDAPFPSRLLEAGANGYVTKDCSSQELLMAVRLVANGGRYLSARVAQQIALAKTGTSPFEMLSPRELVVAIKLAKSLSLKQIGKEMNLSESTVSTYKYRLFEKMGIDNLVTLSHLATVHGLVKPNTLLHPGAKTA